jgi:hypothetical protein
METSRIETANVEETVAMAAEEVIRCLSEFRLAYVGGGIADVIGE